MLVFARGLLKPLLTRVYFPGEPQNEADPLLSGLTDAERAALIGQARENGDLEFDVHLQGDHQTTFLGPGRDHRRPEGARMSDHQYEQGTAVRREVLGDAHVDASTAAASDLTRDFQELITRYAWGEIWTRPGLDRRTRSCIALTALVAGGHHNELKLHLRGARRNGLTWDEVKEVLLQTAVYCGVPAANSAFAVAQRVYQEEAGE